MVDREWGTLQQCVEDRLPISPIKSATMKEFDDPNRRTILKSIGAGVVGSAAITGEAAASPRSNFGYVENSNLEGKTVTLSGPIGREKVFCDAGGSESRIKTEVWAAGGENLYLLPSGYEDGDEVTVGGVFHTCTRNNEIAGEVPVTKE